MRLPASDCGTLNRLELFESSYELQEPNQIEGYQTTLCTNVTADSSFNAFKLLPIWGKQTFVWSMSQLTGRKLYIGLEWSCARIRVCKPMNRELEERRTLNV